MNADGQAILEHLRTVATQRQARAADAALLARVQAVKHFQHARFEASYADLLAQPRYARAARFFLDDLYGPHDFSERDDQFARIVPALVRLFPSEIVGTVRALAELHALSEVLDSAMGSALAQAGLTPTAGAQLDGAAYTAAWRTVAQPDARLRQIELMLMVGRALDRYTRNPLLRHSLRMMRGPARAAGLGALQGFLERGFDTFRDMQGAGWFLDTVASREKALAGELFDGRSAALPAMPGSRPAPAAAPAAGSPPGMAPPALGEPP